MRGAGARLRADCIGDVLTLYVNDQQIARVRDTTLGGGNVALLATAAYAIGGMDVTYRNFRVTTATTSATSVQAGWSGRAHFRIDRMAVAPPAFHLLIYV